MGGSATRPVDPSLSPPSLRLPQNGDATGSVWSERSRQPRFVWDAQPGFVFELQVDDSCDVGKWQSCDFSSPEWTATDLSVSDIRPDAALPVSEVAPVGRRYYWRVRACKTKACSPWSPVRYLDVGRQRSDFDGDGYADVIVPDEGNSGAQGRVLVGFGPAPSVRSVVLKDTVTPQTPDHFGQVATAVGDVDADGFGDLLVTAPGDQQTLPGIAYVFFGSASFEKTWSQDRLLLQAEEPGARIAGPAIAAGDVDADGRQDFVLDSYPTGPKLYRGLQRSVSATLIPGQSGQWLFRCSAGDVTGDGYSDLLTASPANNGTSATLFRLLPGGAASLLAPEILSETTPVTVGFGTIAGDLNADGFSDLGWTVNYPDVSANRIDISWGPKAPSFEDAALSWAGGLTGPYAKLGEAIPAGDVNGDDFQDSLVGIMWDTSDTVQGNLYLGGLGSRQAPDAIYAFQTGILLFISQGIPSAPGDVNADGFDDILLVEDFQDTAKLFFGSPGLDATADDDLALPPR